MKYLSRLLLSALLLPVIPAAVSDTLLIETIESSPPNSAAGVLRPVRGESMEQVRQRFGEPGEIIQPVGNPPITRWVYDKYTVYFERQTVLRSVMKR